MLPISSRTAFKHPRFQELGLVLVVLVLGAILALGGGTVERPKFERMPDGSRQRVRVTDATGEEVPAPSG